MIPAKEAKDMLYTLLSQNLVQLQVHASHVRPSLCICVLLLDPSYFAHKEMSNFQSYLYHRESSPHSTNASWSGDPIHSWCNWHVSYSHHCCCIYQSFLLCCWSVLSTWWHKKTIVCLINIFSGPRIEDPWALELLDVVITVGWFLETRPRRHVLIWPTSLNEQRKQCTFFACDRNYL